METKTQPIKKCSCGNEFHSLPEKTVFNDSGAWFNCPCHSTCFVSNKMLNDFGLSDRLSRNDDQCGSASLVPAHVIKLINEINQSKKSK